MNSFTDPSIDRRPKLRIICCEGDPSCVSFAAYLAVQLGIPLVSIPKPQIYCTPGPKAGDICFGSYWPGVDTLFTYDPNKHSSLFEAIHACLDKERACIAQTECALQSMNDREHGRDLATSQAFMCGLKLRYGKLKAPDPVSASDMFLWYFWRRDEVPQWSELVSIGRDVATYIELEAASAVDAFSFRVADIRAIVAGAFHLGALHDALRKRDTDCRMTLVIRHGFDDNREARVFYSARCYDDETSALNSLKHRLPDVGGNARAAGGSDNGRWFKKLKMQYELPELIPE